MSNDTATPSPFDALANTYIPTPNTKMAFQAINGLMEHGLQGKSARCLLMIGPSDVGKTALIKEFAKLHPTTVIGRQIIRPICIVQVPTQGGYGPLLSATLRALDDPNPTSGDPTARELRVQNGLRRQQVRLLVFEEVQHLVDADTDKIGYKAANFIKTLLNLCICPILLMGMTHADRVTKTNTQLVSRSRSPVELHPFDWRDPEQQLQVMAFLHVLEKSINLPQPSGLGQFDMAWRFAHFSRGLPGYMVDMIREALELREEEGDVAPCLTRELLARAADKLLLREPTRRLNAFRKDPPEKFAPAPMYELLKEPPKRHRSTRSEEALDNDLLA